MIFSHAAPLARASFRLACAFGWTPQQVQTMTVGQIALYLTFLEEDAHGHVS